MSGARISPKVLDRVIDDATMFGIIYTIDDKDDPFDPTDLEQGKP